MWGKLATTKPWRSSYRFIPTQREPLGGVYLLSRQGTTMRPACSIVAVAVLAASAAPSAGAQDRAPNLQGVVGATLIDGTGGAPLPNSVILIRNGRFACVGTRAHCPVPADVNVLDGRGLWALPGFIDLHVHLTAGGVEHDPRALLAAGVTTVRDVGSFAPDTGTYAVGRGQIERIAGLASPLNAGQLVGPRLSYCGPGFTTSDRPTSAPHAPWIQLASADSNVAAIVDYLIARGASCLKIMSGLRAPHMRALFREGRPRGLPVIGHSDWQSSLSEHIRMGWAEIHHHWVQPEELLGPQQLARLPSSGPWARLWVGWALFDPQQPQARRVARAVAQAGIAWVPTIAAIDSLGSDVVMGLWGPFKFFASATTAADSVRIAEALFHQGIAPATPAESVAVLRRVMVQFASAWTRALHDAGVPILAGSDAPQERLALGHGLHAELEYLVRAGLSPLEALTAATGAAGARLHTPPDIGVVATGNLADLVLVEADPLVDIRNTRRIRLVVKGGIAYYPDTLQSTRGERRPD